MPVQPEIPCVNYWFSTGYAKANGLVDVGDQIVVSQCPRKDTSPTMEETGVISLLQVA